MFLLTTKGLLKSLGLCILILGIFILANIAMLTHIYVGYYANIEQALKDSIGLIWLRLAFEPLSGAMIGVTLAFIGMGLIRLKRWARLMALLLMCINFFILVSWVIFTQFQYISKTQFIQVLAMYALIAIFLNLKWVKTAFS